MYQIDEQRKYPLNYYIKLVRNLGKSNFSDLRWATAKKFRVYLVVNGN